MKLTLSLEEADLKSLKEHLGEQLATVSEERKDSIQRVISAVTKLLETDETIDIKVTALLARLSNIPAELIKNEHKLGFHLGIGPSRTKALAGPLTLIAQSIKADAKAVTSSESGRLDTVQSCIDIVKKKLQ